jgi:hypothetical protein
MIQRREKEEREPAIQRREEKIVCFCDERSSLQSHILEAILSPTGRNIQRRNQYMRRLSMTRISVLYSILGLDRRGERRRENQMMKRNPCCERKLG